MSHTPATFSLSAQAPLRGDSYAHTTKALKLRSRDGHRHHPQR